MAVPLTLSSVPSQTPYIQYVATASQTVFPYPFEITQDSDLIVLLNGVQQATDSGYTLSGQGTTGGGNVTFTTGLTGGTIVTIYRNITISRVSQLTQNGTFFSSTFNNEFNKIYLIMQQLQQANGFALQIPNTNNPAGTTVLTPANYANKYLAFDSNGNPEPALLTSSGSLTGSIIVSLLTANQVGSVIYAQTPAELAAGITPTNYAYPHGNILRYGASTSATASVNTVAIQQAITVAQEVYIPDGVYNVQPQANPALAGTFGASSVCFNLPNSNQHIYGPGTIQLASGSSGTSGAIFGNWAGTAINNIVIEQITISGNAGATTGTISGIVIVNGTDCVVRNVNVRSVTYNGIQFAVSSLRCAAVDNNVEAIAYIGIQWQFPVQWICARNRIYNTTNNAIDESANNNTGGTQISQGVIAHNVVHVCLNGIFLESGGDVVVHGNHIDSPAAGSACLYLNQINTPAASNQITGNKFSNLANNAGCFGIYVDNNSGRSQIGLNYFANLKYSIYCAVGAYLDIQPNYHDTIAQALIGIVASATQLVYSNVAQQVVYGSRTSGIPFTLSPINNSGNSSNRAVGVTAVPALVLNGGAAASLTAEYVAGTSNTAQNSAWSNAYSIYTSGQTLVNITAVVAAGDYILINGTLFYLVAFTGGGWHIQNTSFADGNYTATTNGNYATTEYYPSWQTN